MPKHKRTKLSKPMTVAVPDTTCTDTSTSPLYFWRPKDPHGYLGQWYPSPFKLVESDSQIVEYQNAEQYMMHRKGLLFAPDDDATTAILETSDPKAIKALGRQIPNFDEEKWQKHRYDIVVHGNYLKFSQNEHLCKQLLETNDRELVEASPRDRIWGIGYGWKNAGRQREKWGLNLLGKALMDVRQRIKEESVGL